MVGGWVAARASCSGRNPGWTEPSGASSSRRRRSRRQPGHRPGRGRPAQAGQSGRYAGEVQASQRGSSRVPERIGATWPQLAQRAERRWQLGHQGRPVSRDVPHGPLSWQIEQVATGKLGQAAQSGPSAVRVLTGRRRPQLTQLSKLAGSATRQLGQSGRPCSSRVAGSRSAPQRAQGWALAFAMQLRQTLSPPSGLDRRTTRWQRGQAGRTTPVTPLSSSSSISRKSAGTGARWPAPVSRAGLSSSAQARRCWCEGRGATSRTAAATTSASASGWRAATRAQTRPTGSRPSLSGQRLHRGFPARSRVATGRKFPQAEHRSGFGPQTAQYQSWPTRW